MTAISSENWQRSLVKTLSYRLLITILDFIVIYFFTKQVSVATFFVVISNIYTTFAYFGHERIWDAITWGKRVEK